MAQYAQVKSQIVDNIFLLNDASILNDFRSGWDYVVKCDQLNPVPHIGDSYDGTKFTSNDGNYTTQNASPS